LVEEKVLFTLCSTGRLQHHCGMSLSRHQRWKTASCSSSSASKLLHTHFFRHLLVPLCFRDAVSGAVGLHGVHDGTPVFAHRVVGSPGMGVCLRKRKACCTKTGLSSNSAPSSRSLVEPATIQRAMSRRFLGGGKSKSILV